METGLRGVHKFKTMYLASLDVKTVFDAAKRKLIPEILDGTGIRGRIIGALLDEVV